MSIARRLAEYASRRVVLRRRLPAEFGGTPMYVTPSASLRYWKRSLDQIDPMLLAFAREFVNPGDRVWDIGANVGLFSFAAASRAGTGGRVLAVEADDWLAALLRRSAGLSSGANAPVDVLNVAVSREVGVAEFAIARRGRASNFLRDARGREQAGGIRETRLVMTASLDWLLERFGPPRVVKIDVEGAEEQALAGAATLLEKARPIILCEIGKPSRAALAGVFRDAGYTLYPAVGPRTPIQEPVHNTLALPPG